MISNKTNQAMIQEILEEFAHNGINQLKDSLERLYNQLMIAERENHIGAGPYEISPDRRDYSNGFKDKTLVTRSGKFDLKIPSGTWKRFLSFMPEEGKKMEQALKLALAEALRTGSVDETHEKSDRAAPWGRDIFTTSVALPSN